MKIRREEENPSHKKKRDKKRKMDLSRFNAGKGTEPKTPGVLGKREAEKKRSMDVEEDKK